MEFGWNNWTYFWNMEYMKVIRQHWGQQDEHTVMIQSGGNSGPALRSLSRHEYWKRRGYISTLLRYMLLYHLLDSTHVIYTALHVRPYFPNT